MCITFFRIAPDTEDSEFPFAVAFNRDEIYTRLSKKAMF
jgi:uncharacterized protein with NRDE domain